MMEDRAYQNALKRRQRLQAEIKEIDLFLAQWKRFAGTEAEQIEASASAVVGGVASLDMQPNTVSSGETPKRTDLPKEKLAPHIREIILEKDEPMTRGQIVRALAARGITIGGENPSRNMGTIMWRLRNQFVNINKEGYWPADQEYLLGGYEPPQKSGETS